MLSAGLHTDIREFKEKKLGNIPCSISGKKQYTSRKTLATVELKPSQISPYASLLQDDHATGRYLHIKQIIKKKMPPCAPHHS